MAIGFSNVEVISDTEQFWWNAKDVNDTGSRENEQWSWRQQAQTSPFSKIFDC